VLFNSDWTFKRVRKTLSATFELQPPRLLRKLKRFKNGSRDNFQIKKEPLPRFFFGLILFLPVSLFKNFFCFFHVGLNYFGMKKVNGDDVFSFPACISYAESIAGRLFLIKKS